MNAHHKLPAADVLRSAPRFQGMVNGKQQRWRLSGRYFIAKVELWSCFADRMALARKYAWIELSLGCSDDDYEQFLNDKKVLFTSYIEKCFFCLSILLNKSIS